jgi:hypothetical protein
MTERMATLFSLLGHASLTCHFSNRWFNRGLAALSGYLFEKPEDNSGMSFLIFNLQRST